MKRSEDLETPHDADPKLLALTLATVLVACGSETADAGTQPSQNVVQLAHGNPDLSILVEAGPDRVGTGRPQDLRPHGHE